MRIARIQSTQRAAGNRAVQRLIQGMQTGPPSTSGPASAIRIHRDAAPSGPSLQTATSDADAGQAEVADDSGKKAADLDRQGRDASIPLRAESTAQSSTLQTDATAQEAQLSRQATSEAATLTGQGTSDAAHLTAESSTRASALQQEALGTSTQLQGEASALEATATSTEAATREAANVESTGIDTAADAGTSASEDQIGALEAQSSSRVEGLTARTQALVDEKNGLVADAQSGRTPDPEQFRQRWAGLQSRIGPLEQEQAALDHVQGSGDSISASAGRLWSGLTQRGQALFNRVSSVASTAWSTVQGRWASLQGTASAALAALQGRVSAGVDGFKALADRAWAGLQGAATRAWTGLQGVAGSAWEGMQAAATTAWTALKGQANTAWTALQGVADAAVTGLSSKVSGIVNRVSSVIGRIVDAITDAVGSVMKRLRSATAGALDFLRTRASAAWGAVKTVGTQAWEGVKSVGTKAWLGLKDVGTRGWQSLKNAGERTWQGLKTAGTSLWSGLKNVAQRTWNSLKSSWDGVKKRAESVWNGLKGAWDTLRRKVTQGRDWIRRKSQQALDWVKRKWTALKALVKRGLDWLKSKWQWLKSKLKLTLKLPDMQLFSAIPIAGRSLFSKSTGNIPIGGIDVETEAGPIALDAYVRADVAAGFLGGAIGPGLLRNVSLTLDPLEKKASGSGEISVAANTGVGITGEGVLGGSAYWSGVGGSLEGGLRVNGTVRGSAAIVSQGAFSYEGGKFTFTHSTDLTPCLSGTLLLDAVGRVKVGLETSDDGGDFDDGPACALPNKTAKAPAAALQSSPQSLPKPGAAPSFAPVPAPGPGSGGRGLPVSPADPKARAPKGKRHEVTLWEGNWALGEWSLEKCWKLGTSINLGGSGFKGGGGSSGGGGASGTFALDGKAAGGSVAVTPADLPLPQMLSGMFGSAKLSGRLDAAQATAALGAMSKPAASPPPPPPGRMRSQVQQGPLHFGSAVAIASDPKKGVTAYEFELAQSMAIDNWKARLDPKNRLPGEPKPPPVSTLLGGVHKAKSAQSKDIRTRIVPTGGIQPDQIGDINGLRQCTDGEDLVDCNQRTTPIRLDVQNEFGHNLRCTR